MDLSETARKLGLSESKDLIRKASELRRFCVQLLNHRNWRDLTQAIFDRQAAIKLSGMSEIRSFNSLQNSLGVKVKLDIRELGIQFGCIRLIPFVKNGLSLYKQRFIESLPPSRRATADFTRPVFTAVAFYLCSKKHKLKVDKVKLIEVCGTSESEFKSVSSSMKDIFRDVFGVLKEKKYPKEIKGNQEHLDVLPKKRKYEDGGYLPDELSSYKKHKKMEKTAYEDWKSSVMPSNEKSKSKGPCRRRSQTRPDFLKRVPDTELKAL